MKTKTRWKKVHKASGATMIEGRLGACALQIMPQNWMNPNGPAVWHANCGDQHKRGTVSSLKAAKAAALRTATKFERRFR